MGYKLLNNTKTDPLRPVCRKAIYNSREEAEDMIKHIRETRETRQISAYKCDVCGFWHLTSKGTGK